MSHVAISPSPDEPTRWTQFAPFRVSDHSSPSDSPNPDFCPKPGSRPNTYSPETHPGTRFRASMWALPRRVVVGFGEAFHHCRPRPGEVQPQQFEEYNHTLYTRGQVDAVVGKEWYYGRDMFEYSLDYRLWRRYEDHRDDDSIHVPRARQDAVAWVGELPTVLPRASSSVSSTVTETDGTLFLYGGRTLAVMEVASAIDLLTPITGVLPFSLDDLWEFNLTTRRWREILPVSQRVLVGCMAEQCRMGHRFVDPTWSDRKFRVGVRPIPSSRGCVARRHPGTVINRVFLHQTIGEYLRDGSVDFGMVGMEFFFEYLSALWEFDIDTGLFRLLHNVTEDGLAYDDNVPIGVFDPILRPRLEDSFSCWADENSFYLYSAGASSCEYFVFNETLLQWAKLTKNVCSNTLGFVPHLIGDDVYDPNNTPSAPKRPAFSRVGRGDDVRFLLVGGYGVLTQTQIPGPAGKPTMMPVTLGYFSFSTLPVFSLQRLMWKSFHLSDVAVPAKRDIGSTAYDVDSGTLYVFGGRGSGDGRVFRDLWSLAVPSKCGDHVYADEEDGEGCKCLPGYDVTSGCRSWSCHGVSATNEAVCSGFGVCPFPDTCHCAREADGLNCEFFTCHGLEIDDPKVCGEAGKCVGPSTCKCDKSFHGIDCAEEIGAAVLQEAGVWIEYVASMSITVNATCEDVLAPECLGWLEASNGTYNCTFVESHELLLPTKTDHLRILTSVPIPNLSVGRLLIVTPLTGRPGERVELVLQAPSEHESVEIIVAVCVLTIGSCIVVAIVAGVLCYFCISRARKQRRLADISEIEFEEVPEEESLPWRLSLDRTPGLTALSYDDILVDDVIERKGSVIVCRAFFDDVWVAVRYVRVFEVFEETGEVGCESFLKEIARASRLSHPNICAVYGASVCNDKTLVVVTELCAKSSVLQHLSRVRVSFGQKIRMMKELAAACVYLESVSDSPSWTRLLPNYIHLTSDLSVRFVAFSLHDGSESDPKDVIYRAPEVVVMDSEEDVPSSVGVFAFGVIIWVLLTQCEDPYGDDLSNVDFRVACDEQYRPDLERVHLVPKQRWVLDVMARCWRGEGTERPSFPEVLRSLDEESGESKESTSCNLNDE